MSGGGGSGTAILVGNALVGDVLIVLLVAK